MARTGPTVHDIIESAPRDRSGAFFFTAFASAGYKAVVVEVAWFS